MSRPTILVDMDGPLADFDAHIHTKAGLYGWDFTCPQPCAKHRFLTDCVPGPHAYQMRNVINKTRWFKDLPLVEGAFEGIHDLLDHADVWICTKPLEANHNCRDDKARWVRHHLGEWWEQRLIIAPDKSLVRGNILLDDAIKPEWLPHAEWHPVVFSMPFNGEGSKWEHWPHWTWGDPIGALLRNL